MYSEWNQTDRKISGCLQTGEREWRCEDERGAEREGQEGLQGEVRELLEIMDIFIIWNVVNGFMGIYIYVKAYKIIYFQYVVYCMSIIPQ